MDGVLADSQPLHQHAIRLLLAEYGVDWMPDGRDPTVGLTSLESFAIICERHALRQDPRHLDALYTARVLPLLRERVTPLPGVPDVPRALAARGLRLGLASSSGPAVIETTLLALGVRSLFEAVVSGVEVARGRRHASAWVKSSIRSSGCSRPIDTRSRLTGVVVPGPSIDARCSTRLSVPPKLVARVKTRIFAATAIAASAPPLTCTESMPPNIAIWRFAISCPGCDG